MTKNHNEDKGPKPPEGVPEDTRQVVQQKQVEVINSVEDFRKSRGQKRQKRREK